MNPVLASFFAMCLLLLTTPGHSQMVTDLELEALADNLVTRLNGHSSVRNILVNDFTDDAGNLTALGVYLADELSHALTIAGGNFSVFDRDQLKSPASPRQGLPNFITEAVRDAARQPGNNRVNTAVDVGIEATNLLVRNDPRLRGIDAIVEGRVSDLGDNFRVIISVKSRRRSENLTGARGYLTKTQVLLDKYNQTTTGPALTPAGHASHTYRFLHIQAGLLGCTNTGRYLECRVQLTSEETDTELHISDNSTRIVDQVSGREYAPVNMKISDAYGTDRVQKNLVANQVTEAIISFEINNASIANLSLFKLSCWAHNTGQFVIDFRNIAVRGAR